jgi:hypothetical protein
VNVLQDIFSRLPSMCALHQLPLNAPLTLPRAIVAAFYIDPSGSLFPDAKTSHILKPNLFQLGLDMTLHRMT